MSMNLKLLLASAVIINSLVCFGFEFVKENIFIKCQSPACLLFSKCLILSIWQAG